MPNLTKQKMINIITSYNLYPTMNSWNQAYGYSFNVKIHSLPITASQKDNLYTIISDESLSEYFYSSISVIINDWENELAKTQGYHSETKEVRVPLAQDDKRRKNGQLYEWVKKEVKAPIFTAGFNGRSGGHLVLYKWNGHNDSGTGWNHDKDELEAMNAYEVKEIYQILTAFKNLYKQLVKIAQSYAELEVKEIEEHVTSTIKRKQFTQ